MIGCWLPTKEREENKRKEGRERRKGKGVPMVEHHQREKKGRKEAKGNENERERRDKRRVDVRCDERGTNGLRKEIRFESDQNWLWIGRWESYKSNL